MKNNIMSPLVSVIIPAYNAEKHIDACLQSVLSQSLKNIEIVIIDDGSTDSTSDLIYKYVAKDKRIKVYSQENLGSGPARNLGLKKSTGKFIAFMDADDFYPTNNILETLFKELILSGLEICGGSFSYLKNGLQHTDYTGIYKKYTFTTKEIVKFSDYQFDYGYHRFLYSRRLILENKIFFPDLRRFQDPPFFVKTMIFAKKFLALPLITYCYRKDDNQVNWTLKKIEDLILGLINQIEISKSNNLVELHNLNVDRINNDFAKVVQLFLEKSYPKLWELIFKLNNSINTEMLVQGGI